MIGIGDARLLCLVARGAALALLTRPLESAAQGLGERRADEVGERSGAVGAGAVHVASVRVGSGGVE